MIASTLRPDFHILLVEDDPADAALVIRATRDSKVLCDIHHVRDGREALDYLFRRGEQFANAPRPDLILLDLNMPRMDGREVLKDLKEDTDLRTIPVVVLTTSDMERDIEASYDLGANSFVTKPIDLEAFFAAIRTIETYWFSVVKLPK
jgi:CheY-like chemotaxis protein